MKLRITKVGLSAIAVLSTLLITGSAAHAASVPKVQHGGAVTVVVINSTWPTLDPAIDAQDANNANYMDAIYGQLFEQGAKGAILPDLATGYSFSNHNLTVTLDIRHGVKFQDGTPFNAQAVQFNLERDLNPSNACICLPNLTSITSVTTSGKYAVLLHLSQPYSPIIDAFIAEAPNWIVSPTAFGSEPAATFGQHPVGAGPFEVVSNTASSQLTLQKNPGYWEKGHPYLSTLTFITTPADQSAYAALESGQAQLASGITTVGIINQARSSLDVMTPPGVGTQTVNFNTTKAPFNNILAREALLYATDPNQVLQAVSPGYGSVVESQSGAADGLYYEKTVPGYKTYNLAKAEALVSQLGGLTFSLLSGSTTTSQLQDGALFNLWTQAGMKVTLVPMSSAAEVIAIENGNYNVVVATDGNPDPDIGAGSFATRFASTGSFSWYRDATLDGLINQTKAFINTATRQKIVFNVFKYIAANAYADALYAAPTAVIAANNLTGVKSIAYQGTFTLFNWENLALK